MLDAVGLWVVVVYSCETSVKTKDYQNEMSIYIILVY